MKNRTYLNLTKKANELIENKNTLNNKFIKKQNENEKENDSIIEIKTNNINNNILIESNRFPFNKIESNNINHPNNNIIDSKDKIEIENKSINDKIINKKKEMINLQNKKKNI